MSSTAALGVVPPVCPISAAGGKSKHKLVNQCALRLAFKIKCSNNGNYSVNKIYGIVEIGEQGDLEITRIAGKPKADKLIVCYVAVPEGHTDAKAAFDPSFKSDLVGENLVKLSAAE